MYILVYINLHMHCFQIALGSFRRLVYTGLFWVYVALLSVHLATLSVYRALWSDTGLFSDCKGLFSRLHSACSQMPKTIFRTHRVLLTKWNKEGSAVPFSMLYWIVTWVSHVWHDLFVCDSTDSHVTWLFDMRYDSFIRNATHSCSQEKQSLFAL